MNIVLYKFVKRTNSCKLPDNSVPSVAVVGILINDSSSSVTNFKLSIPDAKNNVIRDINKYNYCYIPQFGRYYWIYDWRYTNSSIWIADMVVDVLASFRNCIINATTMAYCLRTDNPDYWNTYLIDSTYPTSTRTVITPHNFYTTLFTADPAGGAFILGVVSVKPPAYGAMNYYIVPPAQMNTLVANMVSTSPVDYSDEDDWKNSGLTSEVLKSIVSPLQYIKSCKWLPVHLTYQTNEEIKLGAWPTGAYGFKLTYSTQEQSNSFNINLIDIYNQTSTAEYEFINKPPYVSFELFNSLIGNIPLDPIALTNVWQYAVDSGENYPPLTTPVAQVRFTVNLVNGILKWEVRYKDELNLSSDVSFEHIGALYHDSKNIAVDLPIAEVTYNYLEQAKSGARAVGAAFDVVTAAKRGIANYAANIAENVLDTLKYTYQQDTGSVGAPNGAFFADINVFEMIVRHTATTPHIPSMFGKPSNRTLTTNNLENYYASLDKVIFNTSVNGANSAMLKAEYDEIIQRLREGVFFE